MKLLPIITISLLALSSCVTIYFTEPQPKEGKRLYEVPKELYGEWFKEKEGWRIDVSGLTNIDIKTDSIGNIIDTISNTSNLNDSLRIYKEKELYIINSRENNDYWEIIILKPLDNGDISIYRPIDPKIFDDAKELKLEEAEILINDEEKTVQSLEPVYNDSSDFQSALFSGQMNLETVRKIITKDNLFLILKNDGSVYEPDEINE